MILEASTCYTHGQPKKEATNYSNQELQNILLETMKNQGIDINQVATTEDGAIDIDNVPPLKLHTVMLRMEEQGLNIKYTKKTVIEIS